MKEMESKALSKQELTRISSGVNEEEILEFNKHLKRGIKTGEIS